MRRPQFRLLLHRDVEEVADSILERGDCGRAQVQDDQEFQDILKDFTCARCTHAFGVRRHHRKSADVNRDGWHRRRRS